MEPGRYLSVLRQHWVVLVASAVLGLLAGVALTLPAAPQYRSTATVFVGFSRGGSVSELVQGSTYTQGLVQSYVRVISTPAVLQPVIDELGLDTTPRRLARSLSVDAALDTVLIDITATRGSAQGAADVANSVAAHLPAAVAALSPAEPDGSAAVTVTTIAPATAPGFASAPRRTLYAAAGLVLGLAASAALVLARALLDTRVRDAEDVLEVTDAPVLGRLSTTPSVDGSQVIASGERGARAEALQRLRTNLQFLDLTGEPQVLVVTSAVEAEGKSTTAVNLAVTLSDAGARVLLVDADLRRPSLHRVLGIEGAVGLSTVLSGRVSLADATQPWRSASLQVLASGGVPPNPTHLVGSAAMDRLLAAARDAFDAVVIDSPPLVPVTDAALLAAKADGALVVVDTRRTHRATLATAIGNLHLARAEVVGVVLNRLPAPSRSAYYDALAPEEGSGAPASAEPAHRRVLERLRRRALGHREVYAAPRR